METYIALYFSGGIITKEKKRKEKATKEILKAVSLFNR